MLLNHFVCEGLDPEGVVGDSLRLGPGKDVLGDELGEIIVNIIESVCIREQVPAFGRCSLVVRF